MSLLSSHLVLLVAFVTVVSLCGAEEVEKELETVPISQEGHDQNTEKKKTEDPAAFCNSYTSCETCGRTRGKCGWCYSSDTCEPGTKKGPSKDAGYYCLPDHWVVGKKQCKTCSAATTHAECVKANEDGCGWCASTGDPTGPGVCKVGDVYGPFHSEAVCEGEWSSLSFKTSWAKKEDKKKEATCPCWVQDNILGNNSLRTMHSVFGPRSAPYWTNHKYSADPPGGFYSYVFPLDKAELYGPLGELALATRDVAAKNIASTNERATIKQRSRFAEIWAHNRPPKSGHQMHYDSVDEGKDGIRNPIATSIYYLSERVGGPTVVTDRYQGQHTLRTPRSPKNNGWLCFPKLNRLSTIDGRVYHGVVSGKPFPKPDEDDIFQRRVTVMIAIWETIKLRDEATWGAARPFPVVKDGVTRTLLKFHPDSNALKDMHQSWAAPLVQSPPDESPKDGEKRGDTVEPEALGDKWEAYVQQANAAPEQYN